MDFQKDNLLPDGRVKIRISQNLFYLEMPPGYPAVLRVISVNHLNGRVRSDWIHFLTPYRGSPDGIDPDVRCKQCQWEGFRDSLE